MFDPDLDVVDLFRDQPGGFGVGLDGLRQVVVVFFRSFGGMKVVSFENFGGRPRRFAKSARKRARFRSLEMVLCEP